MNNSEVKKIFGYNLKRLRKQKKISQIELSEKVDLAFTFRLSSTKQLKKANWDADDRTSAEPFYLLLQ